MRNLVPEAVSREAQAVLLSDEEGRPSLLLTCAPLRRQAPPSPCSPVVGLGQLVGHGREGQSAVFLGAQRVVDPAPVDQAPLLVLHEGLHQDVVLVLPVEAERL